MKLRIAACQILTYPDLRKSTDKVLEWMKKAAAEEIDVVAFPEACLCGYPEDPAYWQTADPKEFAKEERRVIRAAKRLNMAVILGTAHWEDGELRNSLLVIDKGGEVRGRYSKTHLAESWPEPGKRLPIYKVAGVKSCFLICHDVRYPELVRLPAIRGAQICYFCSDESGLVSEFKLSAYQAMPISRATENGIFLVMANVPADADNIKSKSQSHGNSKIIEPQGNVMVEAGHFEERLVVADIDTRQASRGMAMRSVNDETVLKQWMIDGAKLVDG
jgi:predicted amidohydrolase